MGLRRRLAGLVIGVVAFGLLGILAQSGLAQSRPSSVAAASTAVLFENVRVFDGVSPELSDPANVLVVGNTINAVSSQPLPAASVANVTRIDGQGRVLMPGLIDAHTHLFMETSSEADLVAATATPDALFRRAQDNATAMLMRGFTSARDMAGPVF
jgi:imidazolonepropionase-like amidohydrolase